MCRYQCYGVASLVTFTLVIVFPASEGIHLNISSHLDVEVESDKSLLADLKFPLFDLAVDGKDCEDRKQVWQTRAAQSQDPETGVPGVWRPTPLPGSTKDVKIFSRVIFHDIHDKAGINDRLFVLTRMLAFATEVKAVLAFPTPDKMLGKRHGHTSALNWTDYFVTRPKVHAMDGVKCMPGVHEVAITDAKMLTAMPRWFSALLKDTSRPMCLRVKVKYAEIKVPKGNASDILEMTERGAGKMGVWTSGQVVEILKKAKRSNYILRNPYNVVHVRLGDKATRKCSTPSYIVESVEKFKSQHTEHGQYPWLVMSDGDDSFFQQLVTVGKKRRIKFITERELRPLYDLQDNYLRYTVLECIFGGAALALSNFKDHGRLCKVAPHHLVPTHFIGC